MAQENVPELNSQIHKQISWHKIPKRCQNSNNRNIDKLSASVMIAFSQTILINRHTLWPIWFSSIYYFAAKIQDAVEFRHQAPILIDN